MKLTMRRTALSLLLSTSAATASAGVIELDGVIFTSSYKGKVLTVEIDASKRSGGWKNAIGIDAIAIKGVGDFGGVTLGGNLGIGNWSMNTQELKAAGCVVEPATGGDKGKGADKNEGGGSADQQEKRFCYTGNAITLADDMIFTFTFDQDVTLSTPHLKVHFVDAFGGKAGDLLSQDFPFTYEDPMGGAGGGKGGTSGGTDGGNIGGGGATDGARVPEPATLALLGGGVAAIGLARRRRKPRA